MRHLGYYIIVVFVVVGLGSCKKMAFNYVAKNQGNRILYLQLEEQIEPAVFSGDTIYIPVSRKGYENIQNLRLDSLLLSDFAKTNHQPKSRIDFSNPVPFRIVSEDGQVHYYIVVTYYTKGTGNEIFDIDLEGKAGGRRQKNKIRNDTIYVSVERKYFLTGLNLKINRIIHSKDAKVTPESGTVSNYFAPVHYEVTSEAGTKRVYTVVVTEAPSESPQLENRQFENWFRISNIYSWSRADYRSYDKLGKNGAPNIWTSYNDGMAQVVAVANKENNFPMKKVSGYDNKGSALQLTTKDLPGVLSTQGSRGTVPGITFTGQLLNITNQGLDGKFIEDKLKELGVQIVNWWNSLIGKGDSAPAAPPSEGLGERGVLPPDIRKYMRNSFFGIAFSDVHPQTVSFDYKYTPRGGSALDVFVLLESRSLDGLSIKRVGVAWFRNKTKQSVWRKMTLPVFWAVDNQEPKGYYPFERLSLPNAAKDKSFKLPNQPDWDWGNIKKDKITHITVVFSSSSEGITKAMPAGSGKVGSQLIIDNFKLNYNFITDIQSLNLGVQ